MTPMSEWHTPECVLEGKRLVGGDWKGSTFHIGRTAGKNLQVDEDFSCTWLGSIELLDLGRDRAWVVVDKSLVLLGDIDGTHLD